MSKEKQKTPLNLASYFTVIPDPRVEGRCKHLLMDIIVISVCAMLCGAESCIEMAEFGRQKEAWLRKFLTLPHGIPSHDTIGRVFALMEADKFEKAFFEWASSLLKGTPKRICMDGKAVAGTCKSFNQGKSPLHLVNVYSEEDRMVLGQAKPNGSGCVESGSVVALLDYINIGGCLVSVDAASSWPKVTDKIVKVGGDYLIPIKRNQKGTLQELEIFFSKISQERSKDLIAFAESEEKSHGRKEIRSCALAKGDPFSQELRQRWQNLKSVFRVIRQREEKDKRYFIQQTGNDGKQFYTKNQESTKKSEETVYFLSSRDLTATEALLHVRKHWAIENQLHWSLDVIFSEDAWRVREKRAARNMALIRKMAFNLIKKCPQKGSQRVKMKRAAWNNDYLEQLLFVEANPA